MEANKEYIVNLKYGNWRNQAWFQGSDDAAFQQAKSTLYLAATNATNSNEFFDEAIKHFSCYGFTRIQK